MLTQKQLELWFCWVCFLFYPRDLFVVPMVNSAALKKPLGPAVQTSYPQLEKVQLPVSNNNIWRTEWWLGGGGAQTAWRPPAKRDFPAKWQLGLWLRGKQKWAVAAGGERHVTQWLSFGLVISEWTKYLKPGGLRATAEPWQWCRGECCI